MPQCVPAAGPAGTPGPGGCWNYATFNVTGNAMSFAPKWTFTAGVQHSFRLRQGLLTPRLNYSYVGEQWTSIQQSTAPINDLLGARSILNASLSYDRGRWRVRGFVDNLTDELYVSGTFIQNEFYTDAEAAALVRRMVGRWHDDAIAMQLNLLGWRTGTGNHWTRMRVRELRSRLNLPACDPTQPAWLTAKGAARHLGISPAYAGLLLQRGIIPGTQAVPGSMWWVDPAVLDSPQLRETLHALSERRVKRPHDDRTLRFP